MPLTSKKISRLEKEAILRSKDSEYKREQSAHLLTNSNDDEEQFENARHRRHDIMRQTRQIQREIDHQKGLIDKINERRQQELQKKKVPTTTIPTTRNYLTSLSSSSAVSAASSSTSSSITDRTKRNSLTTEKYTSKKHTSGGKFP